MYGEDNKLYGGDGVDSCKKDGTYVEGFDDDCEVGLPTSEPTTGPIVTPAPTLPVGGPAAAACLAELGGDCDSCCGGCTPKTPTDGSDFSGLPAGECVCFEGALSYTSVKLTNSNDCVKLTDMYGGEIRVRVQRPLHLPEPAPRAW